MFERWLKIFDDGSKRSNNAYIQRSRNDGGNDNRRGGGNDRSHSQSNNNQSSDQKKESSRNDHAQSLGPSRKSPAKKLVECSEQSSGAEQKGAEIKYKDARINLALSRRQPPLIEWVEDSFSRSPTTDKAAENAPSERQSTLPLEEEKKKIFELMDTEGCSEDELVAVREL
ncbi:unnamed protein product [Trichogramma brassicae]|uniref:Uncharacterized protein n=1 Tax=Trichogramma brassicae TaxID=86971 RepID=A0A6H5I3Q2_9HYME|nr:unnamed protein product [Trichogramma brassicae]